MPSEAQLSIRSISELFVAVYVGALWYLKWMEGFIIFTSIKAWLNVEKPDTAGFTN